MPSSGLLIALLACSLVSGTSAPSAENFCHNLTISAEDCKSDGFGFLTGQEHSSCRVLELSTRTVTHWQVFSVTFPMEYDCNGTLVGSMSLCALNLTAQWERRADLNLTQHSQELTSTLRQGENGYEMIANASLTLYGIENQPDTGSEYRVMLSFNDCINIPDTVAGDFSLNVYAPICISHIPAPLETDLEFTFTESKQCPAINTHFLGGERNRAISFVWRKSDKAICYTAGATNVTGRYICGWTVNDPNTCNNTVWLVINNCSFSDAGNYSVHVTGRAEDGQPVHVHLSFQDPEEEEGSQQQNIAIFSGVAALVLLIIVGITASLAIYCVLKNCCHHTIHEPTTMVKVTSIQTQDNTVQTAVIGSVCTSISVDGVHSQQKIWKTIRKPQQPLTTDTFAHIAEKVTDWKELARKLKLSEPDITAIEYDYRHNYKEQTVQMLLTWVKQQHSTPTRQTLIRIIEEKMKDRQLAKDIDSALLILDMEMEKPRALTA